MEAGSGFGVQPGGFGVIGWRGEVPDIGRRVRIVTVIPNPGEKHLATFFAGGLLAYLIKYGVHHRHLSYILQNVRSLWGALSDVHRA